MTESLKIAFYTDSFLPAVDGVVVSILNFKEELERRGHEVYVYASGTEKTKQMFRNDKSIIVVSGIKFSKYPQYSLALFPLMSRLKTMHIKADINHAHTPFTMGVHALLLSKIDKTPIVGSFHTMFTDSAAIREYMTDSRILTKMIRKYSWKYARMFYNRCDSVVAPSGTIKSILDRRNIENVGVVPNGIDIKKFSPKVNGSSVRKKLVRNADEKLVMYVGRVSREKRLETLIGAASLLRNDNISFAIIGTGPAQHHYQQLVERMHLQSRVMFLGFVKNDELPKYYSACDAFCIPSTFETQGVVAVEAMASGKPVIGADYLALKELIKDGENGQKFRPNDSGDCAKKIRKVLYNCGSYKGMVSTARRYSIERTTDELLGLYKKILDNKSS